ncbi:MAG: hypothetical protein M5U28_47155 [Sandaracinaceae bacterium]|nr:hypothetical protein [Sandaracinaceae bacterium]
MTKAAKKKAKKKSQGVRIPERAEDMPGGPHGGKPITPPKKKKKSKK